MKNSLLYPVSARRLLGELLALLLISAPVALMAQSDDFNDGNDVGWTRYSPLAPFGVPGVFSFPSGGYRIQTTAVSPDPLQLGNARTGSLRLGTSYTDFYVSVDIVNWNDSLPQAAGILARVSTPALGMTAGYAFTWSRGTTATGGDMDISKITGEVPDGVTVSGNDKYHFVPGRRYRMVFSGKGSILKGRVFELPNVTTPVISITGSDSTYASGISGLVVYDNSSAANNFSDATFDNYVAVAAESPKLSITHYLGTTYRISWPGEATGFVLESTQELPAMTWNEIPSNEIYGPFQVPFVNDDAFSYLADGFDTTYFRLRYAP